LRQYGRVDHVDIGVVAQTVTAPIAEGLGFTQDWGVVIADLMPHGPADAAGLRVGDVMIRVDGHTMQGVTELAAVLYQHPSNRLLKVDVLRGAEKFSLELRPFLVRDTLDQQLAAADPNDSHIDRLDVLVMDFDETLRAAMPDVRSSGPWS